MLLDPGQEAQLLHALHDRLAAGVAVHAVELGAGVGVHGAVVVHHVHHGQAVAQAALVVVRIVGRGDLHRARPEGRIDELVPDQGDLAADDGQDDRLAEQGRVALVLRMDRHGGVAQHGLGAGGGHGDAARAVGEGVAEVPELALLLLVDDLLVGEGRAGLRAPVDDPVALVDQPLLVEPDEDLLDGAGEPLVEGEAFARPVAGGADGAELLDDLAAVGALPFPDALEESLAAEIVAGDVLGVLEELLHLGLGGDAGVVGSRHPADLATAHLLEADQDVLQGVVQHMAKGEHPGHVGRGDDDRVGGLGRGGVAAEVAAPLPLRVPPLFGDRRIIGLGHLLASHGGNPGNALRTHAGPQSGARTENPTDSPAASRPQPEGKTGTRACYHSRRGRDCQTSPRLRWGTRVAFAARCALITPIRTRAGLPERPAPCPVPRKHESWRRSSASARWRSAPRRSRTCRRGSQPPGCP